MSGYRYAGARNRIAGRAGSTGPDDRHLCDQPCRRTDSLEAWSYGPSTSEREGGQS